MTHTLEHALAPEASGCRCNMRDISTCVICGTPLRAQRNEVDTCSKVCTRKLLQLQQSEADL